MPSKLEMLAELAKRGMSFPKSAPVSRIDMGFKDVSQRVPELTIAANLLKAGKIGADDYAQLVNALKPVTPYAFVPKPATRSEAMNALTENKRQGYGGTSKIEGGEKSDLRLDIPAYTGHGVWVNSVHRAGAPTSYSSTSSVNTPEMILPQDKALKVATGETAKSPFAVMRGEWNPLSEKEAVKGAQKYLNDPDWIQVGMDPERHSYFYDRATMQPVIGGEQAVQVGPLVLVKNPVYGDTSEFKFAGGGRVPAILSMGQMIKELASKKLSKDAPAGLLGMNVAPKITKKIKEFFAEGDLPKPKENHVRIFRGSWQGEPKYIVEENPKHDVYGGVFGSSGLDAAKSHGNEGIHYTDIPQDKILTHYDLNYEIPYEKTKAALLKAQPHLADDPELFDNVYKIVVEDAGQDLRKVNDDIINRAFSSYGPEVENEVQRIRGQVSKNLGYQAVEMVDEHGGGTYLVSPGAEFKTMENIPQNPSTFFADKFRGGEVSQDAMRMAVMNQKVQHKAKGGIEAAKALLEIARGTRSRAAQEAAGLYHPIGGSVKMNTPVPLMDFKTIKDPNVKMAPLKIITPESLYGGRGIPLIGDRALAGRIVTDIGGNKVNVVGEGGPNYIRTHSRKDPAISAAWAAGDEKTTNLAKLAGETGDPVYGINVIGSPTNVDFNTMVTKAILDQYDPSAVTDANKKAFLQVLRTYVPNAKKPHLIPGANFVGMDDVDAMREQLMAPGAGNLRKAFVNRLGIDKFRDMGFPDVAHARLATTEPALVDSPIGMAGFTVAKMDTSGNIIQTPVREHTTYPVPAGGSYYGSLDEPVDYQDIFQRFGLFRRGAGANPKDDYRSFSLSPQIQDFDQQWLDNIMKTLGRDKPSVSEYKDGGAVNMKGGSLVDELINKAKKNAPPYVAIDKRYNPPMTGENAPRLAPREGSKKPYFQVPATMFPEGIMRDVAESAYRDIEPSIVFPELQSDPIKTIGQHSYVKPVDIGSVLTEAGIASDLGSRLLGEAVFNATNSPLLATAAAYGPSVAGSVYKGAKKIAPPIARGVASGAKAVGKSLAPKIGDMAENYMLRTGAMLPMVPVTKGGKNIAREKTTFEMQNELAQKRAMLPKDQYGLELPAGNTAAQRLAAMGINTDAYHGTKQNITGAFKPGYDDNLGFVTRDADFANSWIGKGKIQQRADPEAKAELKAAEDLYRAIKEKHMDYGSVDLKSPDFHDIFEKRNDAFQKAFNEDVGLYPDKTHSTVYPLKVQANNTFDPETNMDVMSEFFAKNNVPRQNQELYKSGNYLMYETKPVVNFLKSKGYDSMRLRESTGDNYPTIAVFDPETIRSRFAAGDPFRRNAAVAAAMGVAAPDLLAAEDKAEGGAITSDDLILEERPL